MVPGASRRGQLSVHEHHAVQPAGVSGAFSGADAGAAHDSSAALGLATPAVLILGETFPARDLVAGPARAFDLLGAHRPRRLAAYAYSTLAVFQRGGHLYFDTASMVLMLFTLGRYLEAAGRARASRDLAPLLAAESECATVVEAARRHRRPVREVVPGC